MKHNCAIPRCAAAVLALAVGCGESRESSGPTRTAESSLKQIAVLYGRHVARQRGQAPKSEAEFRKYIHENGERSLKMAAVSNIDELLTSPRDNEQFVIRYGIKVGAPGKSGPPIVAYEKTGSGGRRLAVDSLGGVRQVTQGELDELLKRRPAARGHR